MSNQMSNTDILYDAYCEEVIADGGGFRLYWDDYSVKYYKENEDSIYTSSSFSEKIDNLKEVIKQYLLNCEEDVNLICIEVSSAGLEVEIPPVKEEGIDAIMKAFEKAGVISSHLEDWEWVICDDEGYDMRV